MVRPSMASHFAETKQCTHCTPNEDQVPSHFEGLPGYRWPWKIVQSCCQVQAVDPPESNVCIDFVNPFGAECPDDDSGRERDCFKPMVSKGLRKEWTDMCRYGRSMERGSIRSSYSSSNFLEELATIKSTHPTFKRSRKSFRGEMHPTL